MSGRRSMGLLLKDNNEAGQMTGFFVVVDGGCEDGGGRQYFYANYTGKIEYVYIK
jgi:hypothetical protein